MVKEDRSDWVAVDSQFEHIADGMVAPTVPAYTFFQRHATIAIKEQLIQTRQPSDFGSVATAVSVRWRTMNEQQRRPYEDMAAEDKRRFTAESAMRDAEIDEAQAKKRDEMFGEVVEGTKRSSTTLNQEETEERERRREESAAARQPKQYTQEQLEEKAAIKEAKNAKEAVIKANHKKHDEEKALQATKRLEYLLKQSDIFSHFGKVSNESTNVDVTKKKVKGKAFNSFNVKHGNDGKASEAQMRYSAMEKGNGSSSSSSSSNSALTLTNGPPSPSRRRDSTSTDPTLDDANAENEDEPNDTAVYLTTQPSTIGHGKMRQYQLEGLNWMIKLQEHGVNGILADEMGLGKTLQSISVMVYMKEYLGIDGPHLVVVPKSTLSNWMNEIKRWAPTLRGIKFHGTKEEREVMVEDVLKPGQKDEDRTWDVIVTTYEVCNTEKKALSKFAWHYLIIDEAHRLKNEASLFSQTIRTYNTRFRLLLTGTPLQNNLHELWALLNFLVPDVFSSADQFDEWFNLDIDDTESKTQMIGQLHKILRPFMLRRLKADVEKSLLPKHETILFTGMSAMQKRLYKEILMRDIDVVQGKGEKGSSGRTAVLNIVMQLRKAAGHPYLFPGQEDRTLPPLGEHLVENCGKLVLLDKLLKRLKEKGHRVLIFTQMTKILDILEDYVVMRNYKYCRIDGNTTYEVREDSIDSYNKPDSEKFLFLLSTRAGGLGINLQTADVVILFDSDWNPQADLQAQDRAHRIGQKKAVQVFRLVTEHTIEEKVVERAQQKLKLDAMVVQSGRLKDKDKLSNQDLLDAIRFGADKVFKSKDSAITDDDIDLILEIGNKKTALMNEKIQAAEKGDLLDFKMDGGFNAQTFEGIDYSDATTRAEMLGMFDIGKRERKAVINYSDYAVDPAITPGAFASLKKDKIRRKDPKIPKELRALRMDEHQLYDRERLNEIEDEEKRLFYQLCETDFFLDPENARPEEGYQILYGADLEEKLRLQGEGFANWTRNHYLAFVRGSSKFGRSQFARIAAEVGKEAADVERFASCFWSADIGKKRVSEAEYDRVCKNVGKGEEKLAQVGNMEKFTKMLVESFTNCWEDLEFSHTTAKDKGFTLEEDRYLLGWTMKFGHGQWEAIRHAIRRCDRFKFDYHFRAMSAETIQRRCEQLMRACEREVEQLQKKEFEQLSVEEKAKLGEDYDIKNIQIRKKVLQEEENRKRDKVANENKKISDKKQVLDLDQKIAAMRTKAKNYEKLEAEQAIRHADGDFSQPLVVPGDEGGDSDNEEDEDEDKEDEDDNAKGGAKPKKKAKITPKKAPGAKKAGVPNGGPGDAKEVPPAAVPVLLGFIARAESKGINYIIQGFVAVYPDVSKRQCQKNIEEMGVREKRSSEGDKKQAWYVRDDYLSLCDAETKAVIDERSAERKSNGGGTAGGSSSAGGGNPRGGTRSKSVTPGKKEKVEKVAVEKVEKATADDGGDDDDLDGSAASQDYDPSGPPKDAKKGFTHFCKSNSKAIKANLPVEDRKNKDVLHKALKDLWATQSDAELEMWSSVEGKDLERFTAQLGLHEAWLAGGEMPDGDDVDGVRMDEEEEDAAGGFDRDDDDDDEEDEEEFGQKKKRKTAVKKKAVKKKRSSSGDDDVEEEFIIPKKKKL